MSNGSWTRVATSIVRDVGGSIVRRALRRSARPETAPSRQSPRSRLSRVSGRARQRAAADYPGDYTGPITAIYSPTPDGHADPGEVVWAWIPYEEDSSRGKDRPALIVGLERTWLLALQVTSKDHDRDAEQEARAGRYWMDIGTGPWDRQGRPSEVRLNRVIRLAPDAVRREGAALDRGLFDRVIAEAARHS